MKIDEIKKWRRYPFIQQCPCCGIIQKILTQEDDWPEYHLEIYLECQCGEYMEFVLPVN